jgi:hypothetical protein
MSIFISRSTFSTRYNILSPVPGNSGCRSEEDADKPGTVQEQSLPGIIIRAADVTREPGVPKIHDSGFGKGFEGVLT